MAYIDTPRTDANGTYMSNSHNLENFSVENSLLSPLKRNDDLASQMRNGRGISLKTPRARVPFSDRRNLPAVPGRGEFTPLLQSVARKNLERNGKLSGGPETPAFLKASYQGGNTPALPRADASGVYGGDFFSSSVIEEEDETPVPRVTSSSAQSTPLAVLPKRDPAGVLTDQGNVMTLREQENIIDKIEKDNFGLKLKIHFLEEALRKAGPGYNEIAMKENTDLKVDKVTIQRELARMKKALNQAERDVEAYRRHLEEVQEKAKGKHADENLRRQLEELKSDLATKNAEIKDLRQKLDVMEGKSEELDKIKVEIEDIEADLREKERLVDQRDDEIDKLKEQVSKDSEELDEVYAELEASKKRIEELEHGQSDSEKQSARLREADKELQEALQAKWQAQEDLEELRDEMSNKSMNTKGLSRQLEEKANKLQDDLSALREKYSQLEEEFDDKSRAVKKLQEQVQEAEQDADVRDQRLKDQNELLRNEHQGMDKKCKSLTTQAQQAIKEMQSKSKEKDLLHSRHNALTAESQTLQRDLAKAQTKLDELEENLGTERQHALDNDRQLRAEAKQEFDRLSEVIDSLHRELEDKESQYAAHQDHWESQKRSLQSQKEKAEEQAAGLQRTIGKLQETEGTLSGSESKLQQALESENQRHKSEEAVLERQVQELNADIEEKRRALDDLQSDLSQAKEDLRVSQREQAEFEEKVQALEDEVEVLQSSLDEEGDKASKEINALEQEAESLRSQLEEAKEHLALVENKKANLDKQESEKELVNSLSSAEEQLRHVKSERKSLQDSLASTNLEMRKLQTSSAEVEAERDEVRSQLQQMQNQIDDTFKLDQEKLDLRTSKLKLESDAGRLREERKGLLDRTTAIEHELEEGTKRAASEEGRLNAEIGDLQRKLSINSGGRDRELTAAKQQIQLFERRVEELESQADGNVGYGEAAAELSMIQKNLSTARRKEAEYLQREAAQKDIVRELKQRVTLLERQCHELEVARLTADSPKSSIGGSARKNDFIEVQRQLSDAHQQLKNARAKSKDDLKILQRRLADTEREAQENLDAYEQQREHLESELSENRHEQEALTSKNNIATQTIGRLRTRIASLEKDVHAHRQATTADITIAEERKDLHDMLKDAKLMAEDLQVQLTTQDKQLASATSREKDLRAQLKRVREERTLQTDRSSALSTELENLQARYEHAVDKFSRQQRSWEEERKAMASRVRFTNMSVSSLHADEDQNMELVKRHAGELRGLAKQIQWLRAKLVREEGFRNGLIYEKKYMMMQIEMFEACNQIDLNLLAEMGISQPEASPRLRLGDSVRSKAASIRDSKRPSLRVLGFAVIASVRMKKMSEKWAEQRKIKEALAKKMQVMLQGRKGKGKTVSGCR